MPDASITCRCGNRGEFDECPKCGATRTELVAEGRREGVHPGNDPAQTFAERRQRVEQMLGEAAVREAAIHGKTLSVDPSYVVMFSLLEANNLRLKAICEHLGLKGPLPQ